MRKVLRVEATVLLIVTVVMLAGCAQPQVADPFERGEYHAAAVAAMRAKNPDSDLDEANLLPTLEAGNNFLYAKEPGQSLRMLDEAERIIKYHNEEILLGSTGDLIAKLMINDAAIDYHATVTDAVMVNTYKALDYMLEGKMDEARVELNRAVDRQRRAKEFYAELIQKQKEAIAAKERSTAGLDVEKNAQSPAIERMLRSKYPQLYAFEAYPDFINPFTTYLAGIFALSEREYGKAYSLLKEAAGMVPDNPTVAEDFKMAADALNGHPVRTRHVWIIYENGLAPKKEELRINIPLYLVSNDVIYSGIALPKMVPRKRATQTLSVEYDGGKRIETQPLADMDRVIMTEFRYKYPDIVTRAVFSALLKTYMQYEMNKQDSLLGLAASIYQMATTQADTRVWSSLPKEFQVARIPMPADRRVVLHAGPHRLETTIDPNAKNAIIYVRLPVATAKPAFAVINFK